MGGNTLTTLLFVAPESNLSGNTEFMRIVSGYTPEVVDGMLDRAGLERALRQSPADALHFVGHGGKSVLQLTDGLIDAADLASMLDRQRGVKFVFLNTCDSLAVGTILHNALHVPVICHDAPIGDVAAVRFAERYYREYKRGGEVGKAFDAARETLLRLYPQAAAIPVLINGDMSTRADYDNCMRYLTDELTGVFEHFNRRLDAQDAAIAGLRTDMNRLTQAPNGSIKVMIILIAALVLLQAATPVLNGLLVH